MWKFVIHIFRTKNNMIKSKDKSNGTLIWKSSWPGDSWFPKAYFYRLKTLLQADRLPLSVLSLCVWMFPYDEKLWNVLLYQDK